MGMLFTWLLRAKLNTLEGDVMAIKEATEKNNAERFIFMSYLKMTKK
jgi:hypothetical protein